ncbi:hypothetical protein FIA58_013205 [Flavobacterium jejuense]|uniref:Uncharacterized protein n=1 Tax=Flavobacterium jejuense TaxID=1544455 RepID=A0ABX0IV29_9FLAO|nr:hypothetical protein [Flavobacterium jejuense]NHN26637.1 hypothetical protein [Flavobacterium jejuense]
MNKNIELFEKILKIAEKELLLQYYDSKPENIYRLIEYGNEPLFRPRIISFLENSFDILRETALNYKIEQDKIWNDGFDSPIHVNHILFSALVKFVGMLGEKKLAPLLYKEFLGLKGAFYELHLEKGTVCIALSLLGYEGTIEEILAYLEEAVSSEYCINENKETLEMFYAFCILKNDKTKALEYLNNYKRTKNLSLVAAALADLNVKEAVPILKNRLIHIENPVTKEAFLEAIHRLEIQKKAPSPLNRMIWMFGERTSTEIDLGYESDNQFVLRAIKKNNNSEIEDFDESFH